MSTLYALGYETARTDARHAWTARGWNIHPVQSVELADIARRATTRDVIIFDAQQHEVLTIVELLKALACRATVISRNCDSCHRHTPWSAIRLLVAPKGVSEERLVETAHNWLYQGVEERIVSLSGLLRIAAAWQLSARINITSKGRHTGSVEIVDGLPVSASYEEEKGRDAIRLMETLQLANFRVGQLPDSVLTLPPLGWNHPPTIDVHEDDACADMLATGMGRIGTVFRVHQIDPLLESGPIRRETTGEYHIVWEGDDVHTAKRPLDHSVLAQEEEYLRGEGARTRSDLRDYELAPDDEDTELLLTQPRSTALYTELSFARH